MVSFAAFLKLINKKYYNTFFDIRTGKTFLCDTWRTSKGDKGKFYVFSKHKSYYKSINKELKEWLSENWDRWEDEKEDWFTAKIISKIPIELLPEQFSAKLGVDAKGRRKSIDAMVKAEEKVGEKIKEKGGFRTEIASAGQVVPLG